MPQIPNTFSNFNRAQYGEIKMAVITMHHTNVDDRIMTLMSLSNSPESGLWLYTKWREFKFGSLYLWILLLANVA